MKRSEMIEIIRTELFRGVVDPDNMFTFKDVVCENIAYRVLEAIEKAGMLPPGYKYKDKILQQWEENI